MKKPVVIFTAALLGLCTCIQPLCPAASVSAANEVQDETADKTELQKTAVQKLDDLNFILKVLSSGIEYDESDSFTAENGTTFAKVTDLSRISSADDLRTLIGNTCSGEKKDELLAECDVRFAEKDGVLYVNTAARGSYIFRTEKGVEIAAAEENSFTATTVDGDAMYGFGRAEFVLEGENWLISNYNFIDYNESASTPDSEKTAVAKMDSLTKILGVLSGAVGYDDTDTFTDGDAEYAKVNDFSKFSSLDAFKDEITNTCTGELRDSLIKECDNRFIEKDGVLYVIKAARGYIRFETSKGVVITNKTSNSFTATTVDSNQLDGFGRAEFILENNDWLISSYENGDFSEILSHEETAVKKMDSLTRILKVLSGAVGYDDTDTFTEENTEYAKVNDFSKFSSLDAFKDEIANTCTGELRDSLIKECESRFIEKDGVLYVSTAARGYISFETSEGVIITNENADSFSATTVGGNQLDGHGKAEFIFDGRNWLISSYETGFFAENTSTEDLKASANLRMKDLTYVFSLLAMGSDKDTVIVDGKEYGKVSDDYSSLSLDAIHEIINKTCTGEAREYLADTANSRFIEKDGQLYVVTGARGYYIFHTDEGINISNADENGFTAVTVGSDAMYGYGKANFTAVNGKWLISSYEFGDFSAETTVAATTEEIVSTTTTAAETGRYSDEELCNFAIENYIDTTGKVPSSSHLNENEDNTVTIIVSDSEGMPLEFYTVDPTTGKGKKSNGEDVCLPQTGNNSFGTVGAAAVAIAFTLAGSCAVAKSGILRKKKDED